MNVAPRWLILIMYLHDKKKTGRQAGLLHMISEGFVARSELTFAEARLGCFPNEFIIRNKHNRQKRLSAFLSRHHVAHMTGEWSGRRELRAATHHVHWLETAATASLNWGLH